MSSEEESSEGSLSDPDEAFKAKHECTDIPCCALFVVSLVFFIGIFCWARATGSLGTFYRGMDVNGQLCGLSPNVSDRPFLYFCPKSYSLLRQMHIDLEYPVCLSECPTGTFDPVTNVSLTTPAAIPECPVPKAYLTDPAAGVYCLPRRIVSSDASQEVAGAATSFWDSSTGWLLSLRSGWPVLLLVVLASTVLGYVYLWLLRVTAKCLIWICVLVSLVLLIGGGIYIWMSDATPDVELQGQQIGPKLQKALAIFLWIMGFVVACLACCCASSVELSTACVQTGTLVIWRMPLMLLSPFIKAVTKAFLALLFLWGFAYLWTIGEVSGRGLHHHYDRSPQQWGLIIFYMLVAFWALEFVTALYQFSIAYAVAKYYRTPDDEDGDRDADCCGIAEGAEVGVLRHAGSLAYGAAIIAFFQLAQKILEYAERKNEELESEEGELNGVNKCISCMLKCCLCCCKCMEGIIAYINKNAYIDIAVTGDNSFCGAVRGVMHVIIDFGPAMAILNGATVIFQTVGMVCITALCGVLAYAVLSTSTFSEVSSSWYVQEPMPTVVIACLLALIVAWAFMAIFDVTTDTLLYCYAFDKQSHEGQAVNAPEDMRRLYEEAEEQAKKRPTKPMKHSRYGSARE